MDLSTYTVEQLQALIKIKNSQTSNGDSLAPVTTQVEKELCDFRPTRANQPACQESPHVRFGPKGFCKKHARSVQALNAKKEYSPPVVDTPAPPQREPTPEPVVVAPPVVEPEPVVDVPAPVEQPPQKDPIEEVVEKAEAEVVAAVTSKTAKTLETKPSVVVKRTIRPNAWGRYEDVETKILFNPKTKAAFGVQDHKTGRVLSLEKKHIALCEKYRWKYHVIEDSNEDDELEEIKSDSKEEDVEEEGSENVDEEQDDEEQEESEKESGEEQDDEEQEESEKESGEEQGGEEQEDDEEENDTEEEQYDEGPSGSEEDEEQEREEEEAEICEVCKFEGEECICEIE